MRTTLSISHDGWEESNLENKEEKKKKQNNK